MQDVKSCYEYHHKLWHGKSASRFSVLIIHSVWGQSTSFFRSELFTESQIFSSTLSLMSHKTNSQDCRYMHFKPRHYFLLNVWYRKITFLPQITFFTSKVICLLKYIVMYKKLLSFPMHQPPTPPTQYCNGWKKTKNTVLKKEKKPQTPRWLQEYFLAAFQHSYLVNKYFPKNTKSNH